MKKQLLILSISIVMVSFSLSAFAQFPNKDANWEIQVGGGGDGYFINAFVEKDTVINDLKYSVIDYEPVGSNNKCALRSDSLKVYCINLGAEDENEFVLYDFTLEIGDTFSIVKSLFKGWDIMDKRDFKVGRTSYVKIQGENRRTISMGLIGGGTSMTWIEGVGSDVTPTYHINIGQGEVNYGLYCYSEKGKSIYGWGCEFTSLQELDSHELFLSVTNKELLISGEIPQNSDIKIFDYCGVKHLEQRLTSNRVELNQISQGVYIAVIENGKTKISHKIKVQ